jgi:hypothetical protein
MSKLERAPALDLVRAIFCHDRAADLLLRSNKEFMEVVVMEETVVDLYRLNRRGRLEDDHDDHDDDLSAAARQVVLLASLQDNRRTCTSGRWRATSCSSRVAVSAEGRGDDDATRRSGN